MCLLKKWSQLCVRLSEMSSGNYPHLIHICIHTGDWWAGKRGQSYKERLYSIYWTDLSFKSFSTVTFGLEIRYNDHNFCVLNLQFQNCFRWFLWKRLNKKLQQDDVTIDFVWGVEECFQGENMISSKKTL